MDDVTEFLVLRYSLIEEAQASVDTHPLPEPKGKAVEIALRGDREYASKQARYAFVGFTQPEPRAPYVFPASRFLVGKVAKLRKTHVGEKVPGDIIEHVADDWIPLITVVDVEAQHVLIQRNWRFGTDSQIARAVEAGMRDQVLAYYNHRVFVEPRTAKEDFWKVIEANRKIYRLELRLISPNILDTNEKAKDALEALKELYGQDEVALVLENETGSLKVPKEPVADYIDYIAEGEGRWSVVTEGSRGGKKKHKSESAPQTIQLSVPNEDEVRSEGQLELESGAPAPSRDRTDLQLIAEAYTETQELARRREDD
ncbi:MAG: hypothetical protein V2J24_22340 [Pseudomonadales bacterium]|jgi:hypothetical protein|nr:hypothetical protein [Pseudomonadales bacterium]